MRRITKQGSSERGAALVLALLITAALTALVTAYAIATMGEAKQVQATLRSTHGYLAAEAGLNLRSAEVRRLFEEWETPTGTPPANPLPGQLPCTPATGSGSGDFACRTFPFSGRSAVTYVNEEPGNPVAVLIPPGERHAGLFADEWRYTVSSTAVNEDDFPETILDMRWKTRSVPIFQFFALYDRDLELHPGSAMTIHGPIHSNEDIYLDTNAGLDIYDSEISLVGNLYSGKKWSSTNCYGDTVSVDANVLQSSPMAPPSGPNDNLVRISTCRSNRTQITQAALDSAGLGNTVRTGVSPVAVPPVATYDPPQAIGAGTGAAISGGTYWQKADLRVVLVLRSLNGDGDVDDVDVDSVSEATYGMDFDFDGDTGDTVDNQREMWIEIRNPDNSIDLAATRRATDPRTCPGMFNESPNSSAANRPVGAPGGSHPAALWYTSRRTFDTDAWRWKNATGSKVKHGLQDFRETDWHGSQVWIALLEVDLGRLFDCLHSADAAGADILYMGRSLDDTTNGGLVFYFTVDGPDSAASRSDYGVRIRNGSLLASTIGGAPAPVGLTIVTDQAAYLQGDFNLAPNWIPTALLADTTTVLSTAWLDDPYSTQTNKTSRPAANTTQAVAFLAGTTESGDDNGVSSGGLHNYPRFLEYWGSSRVLNLATSFVSLYAPRHNESNMVCCNHYTQPVRNWDFDQRFRVSGQLPPMTPRFTYSRQEMMARSFDW